ncbi:MAG: YfiR family protein [Desulfuromonadales bacterium]
MKWFVILLLTILSATLAYGQEAGIPQEYQVKARYLLNIPLFSEMSAQVAHTKFYTICLIGDTPLESVLASSIPKQIKNLPLAVRSVENFSKEDNCQMLFIASSERHRLNTLLPEAHRQGILTISDMRDFTRLGGMISLLIVDNRVIFDLNLAAAGKASISFSTHMLKLARDIIN